MTKTDPTRTDNLRWVSWQQAGNDCRPVMWPPPEEILAFWETGMGGDDDTPYVTVVALVRSKSSSAAASIIQKSWTPGVEEWRFNREYLEAGPPGDRFPMPKWSRELGRWPWSLK